MRERRPLLVGAMVAFAGDAANLCGPSFSTNARWSFYELQNDRETGHGVYGDNCSQPCLAATLPEGLSSFGSTGVAVPAWSLLDFAFEDDAKVLGMFDAGQARELHQTQFGVT